MLDVVNVHNDAAPGKMTRAGIVPFADPAVKTDAAAKLSIFQRRLAFAPTGLDLCGLFGGQNFVVDAAISVVFIRVINFDPMPAVIIPVFALELAAMFPDDEIHTDRRFVVALDAL